MPGYGSRLPMRGSWFLIEIIIMFLGPLKYARNGFTMTEILVTLVILGVLVSFALPNLTRMRERSYARQAIDNLLLIHAAAQARRLETQTYWPPFGGPGFEKDIQGINADLNLNIIPHNNEQYACSTGLGVPVEIHICGVCRPTGTCPNMNPATVQPSNSYLIYIHLNQPLDATNPNCISASGFCP